MGYFAGKVIKESSVAFSGISKPSMIEAKMLSAALGTSGSCGMFTLGKAKEKISFDRKEAKAILDELSTANDGDIITLGSPQLGMNELDYLAKLVEGKKFNKRCMIFCSRAIHNQATNIGLTAKLERSGAEFMCDSCTCLTPYVTKEKYDSIVSNSVKGAYYMGNSNKVKVALKDIKTIAKEYTE
jgi:hypothetical protein